jgi:hypothetical protein
MARFAIALAVVSTVLAAPRAQTDALPRHPWGDPDLEGTWTNATLTTLQRSPELGTKAFFTPEEAAAFDAQRVLATNADRPLRAGEVGAYNDVFFERGRGGVKTRRTSLIVDPPDGRIPAFTPEAQTRVDARQQREAQHPADRPDDRWLTERCILFGATVPMLPEPYNNNYKIVQSPGLVTILVEMNHDARVIPVDGRPPLSSPIAQWTGSSRGRWEGETLVVETANFKFNEKSRFGVQYLNGLSDEHLRIVERFTRTDAHTLMSDGLHTAVDDRDPDGTDQRRTVRGRLSRGQLRDDQHLVWTQGGGTGRRTVIAKAPGRRPQASGPSGKA